MATDVLLARSGNDPARVDLRIRIFQARPLRGSVARAPTAKDVRPRTPADPVQFVGWLELLRALSDLLVDETGQLQPRADRELGENVRDVGLDRTP